MYQNKNEYKKDSKPTLVLVVTKASWGGAQRYVYDMACACESVYRVVVFCGANEFDTKPVFTNKLEEAGIEYQQITSLQRNFSLFKELRSLYKLWCFTRMYRPQVMHFNSPKAAGLGGLVAALLRVPQRVYTLHGLASAEECPIYQKAIINLLSRLTMLFVHAVIVPTRSEQALVEQWAGVSPKLRLIYTGIPTLAVLDRAQASTKLAAVVPQELQKLLADPHTQVIMGVGEINANKSWDTLIGAVALLKQEGQQVVGIHIGTGEGEARLQAHIRSSGLEQDVYMLGFVSEAYRYIALADVFVLPSQKELLGYVLLEAAQVPLPVVASHIGGIPELILHGKTGSLFPVGDAPALARAIRTYLTDQEVARKHALALASHCKRYFSFEHMIEATQAVYAE